MAASRTASATRFTKQLVYDEQGQLLNASFMDYLLPTATDVPPIETAHRETPSPFNVLGLKGVGEAGCIPTGAVFAQAVEDALGADSGLEIREIPMSPNRLFELIEEGAAVMNLSGTFTFAGPRADCLGAAARSGGAGQGAARHEDADAGGPTIASKATMKVSIGPVTAAEFAVTVTLERSRPSRRTSRCRSTAKAASDSRAARRRSIWPKQPDGGTVMTYSSDVQIGGRIAAVGQRLIESVGAHDDEAGARRA